VKTLSKRTVCVALSAIAFWILDRALCDLWIRINAPVLHSIFHVLIFFSASSSIVLFAYFKAAEKASHLAPNIAYWPSADLPEVLCLPYVYFGRLENNEAGFINRRLDTYRERATSNGTSNYSTGRSEIKARRDLKLTNGSSYKHFV
jgi:hypothetical protein